MRVLVVPTTGLLDNENHQQKHDDNEQRDYRSRRSGAACRRIMKPTRVQPYLAVACLLWGASPLAAQSWRNLQVAPESRCSPYQASDYAYPQSIEGLIVESLGGIWGPYTGRTFTSGGSTDIEHIVARSEAHDSGLCAATVETRRIFATDLLNLTLASPTVNRSEKNDRDAADWLPAQNRCWFADRVLRVRQKYGLTIDRREAETLDQVLAACTSRSRRPPC